MWEPSPEGWVEINMDAFNKPSTRSASIGYAMRDNRAKIIMATKNEFETILFC